MLPLLGLALVTGAVIAVDDDGGGCPAAADVRASLQVRMPGHVVGAEAAPPEAFRLHVGGVPGAPVVRLFDGRRALRLQRSLRPSDASGARAGDDCAALAEAVALIVERYFRELPADTAPPPSASPATSPVEVRPPQLWAALLRVKGRSGRPGAAALALEGALDRDFHLPKLTLNVEASVGTSLPAEQTWTAAVGRPRGAADRSEFWVLVAGGPSWQWGRHWLAARASVGMAVLRWAQTLPRKTSALSGGEPWGGAEMLYRASMGRRGFFIELGAAVRLAVVRHQLTQRRADGATDVVGETPRVFADLSIGAGFRF